MRKIKVKRLVYSHNPNMARIEGLGHTEYDSALSDENILGALFNINNCEWSTEWKNMIIQRKLNETWYIQVQTFYQYQKSWYDKILDNIKRWFA